MSGNKATLMKLHFFFLFFFSVISVQSLIMKVL